MKNFQWKLEYSILAFVIFTVVILLVPISFTNTRQANFIAKWNEKYNRVEYMFSVINAHITDDIIKSYHHAKDSESREKILTLLVKPYLRLNTDRYPYKRHYRPRYKNGTRVIKGQDYYFDELYYAENNSIVGIKDINTQKNSDIFFRMMFDINGLLPPNVWGKDIYGVNIYEGGKIKAFGEDVDLEHLKSDCSDMGTGVYCSYYYKIGGGFDE